MVLCLASGDSVLVSGRGIDGFYEAVGAFEFVGESWENGRKVEKLMPEA